MRNYSKGPPSKFYDERDILRKAQEASLPWPVSTLGVGHWRVIVDRHSAGIASQPLGAFGFRPPRIRLSGREEATGALDVDGDQDAPHLARIAWVHLYGGTLPLKERPWRRRLFPTVAAGIETRAPRTIGPAPSLIAQIEYALLNRHGDVRRGWCTAAGR